MTERARSRVVVTGGSGFIGGFLVAELLEAGHEVAIFDREPSDRFPDRVIPGDVRDPDAVAAALRGSGLVYHLAAEHRDDVRPASLYYDVNVAGTENVAGAARAEGVRRIVFTSTAAVYGLEGGRNDEETEPTPFNDYGRSKLQAERILEAWAEATGGSLLIVRPTAVFGEGNKGNVQNLIDTVAADRFVMVGNGENRKSLAYVENLAAYLARAAAPDAGGGTRVVNYADKPDLTMNELLRVVRGELGRNGRLRRLPYWAGIMGGYAADAVARLTGRSLPISSVRVRKFCASTRLATDRLASTDFEPPYTLPDGLRKTIRAGLEAAGRN